jgi:hypothetical protein
MTTSGRANLETRLVQYLCELVLCILHVGEIDWLLENEPNRRVFVSLRPRVHSHYSTHPLLPKVHIGHTTTWMRLLQRTLWLSHPMEDDFSRGLKTASECLT